MILSRKCQRRATAIIRLTLTTIICHRTVQRTQFYNTKSSTNIFPFGSLGNCQIKQAHMRNDG